MCSRPPRLTSAVNYRRRTLADASKYGRPSLARRENVGRRAGFRAYCASYSEQNGPIPMTSGSQIDFPPIETADAQGLLMLGGEFSPAWLLAAYNRGIFPWPLDESPRLPCAWWCPDPRAIFEFENFHVSRRLARTLRSKRFEISLDRDFVGVIRGCAAPRHDDGGVWLTRALQEALIALHHMGYAHSVEAWQNEELAGGVYGVALGGFFSAESMFHRQRDASKVALAKLMEHLQQQGFTLVDVQVLTEHTTRMGATEIPRDDFLTRLQEAVTLPVKF